MSFGYDPNKIFKCDEIILRRTRKEYSYLLKRLVLFVYSKLSTARVLDRQSLDPIDILRLLDHVDDFCSENDFTITTVRELIYFIDVNLEKSKYEKCNG